MKDIIREFATHDIIDKESLSFDPKEYSKFKHGCGNTARKFGYEMAELFIHNDFKYRELNKPVVTIPSPFQNVPPSAYALMTYFKQRLNYYLFEKGAPASQEVKIFRELTYNEDFGKMGVEERMNALKQDKQYIDGEFTKNKIILCVDDVKITGTHQKVLTEVFQKNRVIDNVTFLYFAQVIGNENDPTIEDYLNHAYVKTLYDLDKVIKTGKHYLNARTIKFILGYDPAGCKEFLEYQTDHFLHSIFSGAIDNNYANDDKYKENFKILRSILKERLRSEGAKMSYLHPLYKRILL